jgi:hypothetical protein
MRRAQSDDRTGNAAHGEGALMPAAQVLDCCFKRELCNKAAKSHHLELKVDASPEAGKKAVNDGNEDFAHDTDAMGHHLEKPGFLRRTEFMGGTARHNATPSLRSFRWRLYYPRTNA